MASIANTKQDFDELLRGLSIISKEMMKKEIRQPKSFMFQKAEQIFTPREALYKSKKKILFKKSQGFVSGEYMIPYPPGVPLIIPCEKINTKIISQVIDIISSGGKILGLSDNSCETIKVII